MAEQLNGDGIADTDAGGKGGENQSVSYESYKKLLDQRKADQARLQEVNAKLAEIESERKSQEEKALIEKQEWEKVANQRLQELEAVKQGKDALVKTITMSEKRAHFEKVAGMQLAHDSFADHINFDNIVYDANGDIDETSVKLEVERFSKEFGNSLFKAKQINTPPAGAALPPAQKSLADFTATELAAAKKAALAARKGN